MTQSLPRGVVPIAYQAVFKRYELKFLLTSQQKQVILAAIDPHMALDQYGRTTIRNIYYDTGNYRLIRRSIEKPDYKEKLRIRSYSRARPNSTVFVELKKKYDSVVYKRRLPLSEEEALEWIAGNHHCKDHSQISKEIDYFLTYYSPLRPTVFLSYEREAYYSRGGDDFRVTFDDHILARQEDISLESEVWGTPLLPDGLVLMEIKCSGGIPLWMTKVLSREHIYKTSFSKYAAAYQMLIFPHPKEANIHA